MPEAAIEQMLRGIGNHLAIFLNVCEKNLETNNINNGEVIFREFLSFFDAFVLLVSFR